MDFFSQTYSSLLAPPTPQDPLNTIQTLSDRLSPSTLLSDRRAAVLALKNLASSPSSTSTSSHSSTNRKAVGDAALPGLTKQCLCIDALDDEDIARGTLETLVLLVDTEGGGAGEEEDALRNTDVVLATPEPLSAVFALLANPNTTMPAIQLLSHLLQNRRAIVQKLFLRDPKAVAYFVGTLSDGREVVRNEILQTLPHLSHLSPDIQKILAFEGAFERLFALVTGHHQHAHHQGQEQDALTGLEGGSQSAEALRCVDGLLRYNTSNQSYFRASPHPTTLLSLLLYPPSLAFPARTPNPPTPTPPQGGSNGQGRNNRRGEEQEEEAHPPHQFALQFWDAQKTENAALVVGLVGVVVGGGDIHQSSPFVRCLVEIALASNAPTPLKTEALRHLPPSLSSAFPLSALSVTPYIPVPDSNGEEWDRLESASALDALVELVLRGEYDGGVGGVNGGNEGKRVKDGMELRCAAVTVFENFVRNEEVRLAIIDGMLDSTGSPTEPTPLLHALAVPPPPSSATLDPNALTSTHLATFLFAHLVRSSPRAKALAARIKPPPLINPLSARATTNAFFVPADGAPPPPPDVKQPGGEEDDEEEDEVQTLLQTMSENLSLALLARSRTDNSDREAREWDRLVTAYLVVLAQWLWEEPAAVREFLEAGGLGVLVDPINQSSEVDIIVPGLCAFLLGICYEFNREPGEITRSTIYPILNRLGVETLVGRMTRLREDERFKAISPDAIVLSYPTPASSLASHMRPGLKPEVLDEAEVWFDWAFVDFWKSNYYTVQRGFSTEPNQLSSASGQNVETAMLIASLRQTIQAQSKEIVSLQEQLAAASGASTAELNELKGKVSTLSSDLQSSEERRKDVEKEQEDLLVLLDEVSSKRRKDKERLRAAGLEVSEDEADDDDEDDED